LTICAANLTLLAGGIGARGGRRVSKSPAQLRGPASTTVKRCPECAAAIMSA